MQAMTAAELQALCENGNQRLMHMQYRSAEQVLMRAEAAALAAEDFDTLGRLYLPLQEARRQQRQICGEGAVRLDLWPASLSEGVDAEQTVQRYPHGQLMVADWASIAPAARVRALAHQRQLYLECFLGAVYPVSADGQSRVIVIVPTDDAALPPMNIAIGGNIDALSRNLPPFSIVLAEDEILRSEQRGGTRTFGVTMELWERLHLPFLNAAAKIADPLQRIEAYRQTIRVDYACEKAHQWLAETALELARRKARAGAAQR